MSWVSASDQRSFGGNQQVRVHFAENCIANPSMDQISQAIAEQSSVASVADISSDITASVLNTLNNFGLTAYYIATINPVDGSQAGQVRADVMTALNQVAQAGGISCNNFTVGQIEYDDGASFASTAIFGPGGAGLATKGVFSLGFLAILAVVVLIFVKVR
jgi:hypothetical protein